MNTARIRFTALWAILILAIVAVTSVTTRQASAARTSVHASSPVGLAPGQRASLQWTNLSNRQVAYEMFFLDGDGSVKKVSRGLLLPARSVALELGYDELGSRTLRTHTRAVLRVIGAAAHPPTLEVFDEATGKTSFGLLLPAVNDFDPQPDPPGQS